MKSIQTVLMTMNVSKFANLAEQVEREARANARLVADLEKDKRRAEWRAEAERREVEALGRPEYKYAKNAVKKENLYSKYLSCEVRNAELWQRKAVRDQARLIEFEKDVADFERRDEQLKRHLSSFNICVCV
jgi:hypothetical protein